MLWLQRGLILLRVADVGRLVDVIWKFASSNHERTAMNQIESTRLSSDLLASVQDEKRRLRGCGRGMKLPTAVPSHGYVAFGTSIHSRRSLAKPKILVPKACQTVRDIKGTYRKPIVR